MLDREDISIQIPKKGQQLIILTLLLTGLAGPLSDTYILSSEIGKWQSMTNKTGQAHLIQMHLGFSLMYFLRCLVTLGLVQILTLISLLHFPVFMQSLRLPAPPSPWIMLCCWAQSSEASPFAPSPAQFTPLEKSKGLKYLEREFYLFSIFQWKMSSVPSNCFVLYWHRRPDLI